MSQGGEPARTGDPGAAPAGAGLRATRWSLEDLAAGNLFVCFGAYAVIEAQNYELGTPLRMGPGYLPMVFGGVLAGLGLAIIAKGFRSGQAQEPRPLPWRGAVLIALTIVFFGLAIRGLGFVPTVLIGAAVTAFASRANGVLSALAIALGLAALSTLVFVLGLKMTVPLVGPWLGA